MKFLAIIPARGGSKSIPLKNIKIIKKKPLINYTIDKAIKSKIFNHIVVSTDHRRIKKVCSKYKNLIIYDRPKKISTDIATTESVVKDVLQKIKFNENFIPDWIFILEPTSPMRSVSTIKKAKNYIIKNKNINSLIGVKAISNTPGLILNKKIYLIKKRIGRRQDRKQYFEESGTIYCVKNKFFIKKNKIVDRFPNVLIVPKIETIDINDYEDLKIAKKLII